LGGSGACLAKSDTGSLRRKSYRPSRTHLVVGATPDDQIVVRTNGDPDVVRSFGEDLKNIADELTAAKCSADE
jgi:hypothetical protein